MLAYRGGDLSIKSPRGPASGRERLIAYDAAPAGPDWLSDAIGEAGGADDEIWVDGAVLKCCNQAYELALAHRSPEVRLEHLVHAMTLVPAAIAVLRAAGVSDATLRRESGIIIAQDMATVPTSGAYSPETSHEMADVLRHAAGHAYRHRSPVTIDDILQTLLDMTRENPTRSLLSRHRAEWSLREGEFARTSDAGLRERGRSSGRARNGDLGDDITIPTMTDSVQNARIDALERTVRELLDALRVRDARPVVETEAPVAPQPRPQAGGIDEVVARIGDVETAFERRFRELSRTWNVLGDRLQTLEDLLMDGEGTSGPNGEEVNRLVQGLERLRGLETLPQRLDRLETIAAKFDRLDKLDHIAARLERLDRSEALQVVERKIVDVETTFRRVLEQLDKLDRRIDARGGADFDLNPIRERLEHLAQTLATRPAGGTVDLAPFNERLDALSRMVAERPGLHGELMPLREQIHAISRQIAERGTGGADVTVLATRLTALQDSLKDRVVVDLDHGPVLDRLKELDGRIGDANLLIEAIADRIDSFDGNVDSYRAQVSQTSATLGTEIRAVGGSMSAQQAAIERVRALVERMPRPLEAGEIATAVTTPFQAGISALETLVAADRQEQRQQFEYIVKGLAKSAEDHRSDLAEVHDAMIKLNANQQTLAQSMDRWRLDVTSELGAVATRVAAFEQGLQRRMVDDDARYDSLSRQVEHVTTVIARKEQRRSGLLMWLFGTEDWWSDGWRTPEEREAAKGLSGANVMALRDGADLRVTRTTTTTETTKPIRPEERRLHG